MMRAILLTGSNAPSREAILARTASLLEQRVGEVVRRSRIYTSEAWGFACDEPFANEALMIRTSLSPLEVLDAALEVEQIVGRDRESERAERLLTGQRYASRVVDVDLILCEEMVIDTPRLKVPHPLMHEREFVLRPLVEIAPEWRHPLLERSVEQLYEDLMSREAR